MILGSLAGEPSLLARILDLDVRLALVAAGNTTFQRPALRGNSRFSCFLQKDSLPRQSIQLCGMCVLCNGINHYLSVKTECANYFQKIF